MDRKINISKIAIWLIVAVVVFCVGQASVRYYHIWRLEKDLWIFTEEGMSTFLKSDTYGGDTPQETYEMFVMALKNNDIDSASKFFYWRYQEIERKKFEDLKNKGTLEDYIKELPEWEELEEEEYWDKDIQRFILTKIKNTTTTVSILNSDGSLVEALSPPGEYVMFSINFYFNKYSKVWKIYEKL